MQLLVVVQDCELLRNAVCCRQHVVHVPAASSVCNNYDCYKASGI